MSKLHAFWDTSALVPLCASQATTPLALRFYNMYLPVVWWATHVEISSALARLLREQQIAASSYAQAQVQAEGLANLWSVIPPSARIEREARAILKLYPLRAADALQLAAALEWCEGNAQGRIFLTFDKRLREAAGLAGFTLG